MKKLLITVDLKRNIRYWSMEIVSGAGIITYGVLNGKGIVNKIPINEAIKRLKEKLNDGYIEITSFDDITAELKESLYYKKDLQGILKPMLAETYIGQELNNHYYQPKLNGIRNRMEYIEREIPYGLFTNEIKGYSPFTRECEWLYLPEIEKEINSLEIAKDFYIDGEIYLHGKSLEEINSAAQRRENGGITNSKTQLPLEYHIYDIVCKSNINDKFENRLELLKELRDEIARKNCKYLKVVSTFKLDKNDNVETIRDNFIKMGYEGVMFRDGNSPYYFGHRPEALLKYKKSYSEIFVIKDIKLSSKSEVVVTLINDINDEEFNCSFAGITKTEQFEYFKNKNSCIGNKVTVQFFERTKDKRVPRHAKIIIK